MPQPNDRVSRVCAACGMDKKRVYRYLNARVAFCNACNQHWRRHKHTNCQLCTKLRNLEASEDLRGTDIPQAESARKKKRPAKPYKNAAVLIDPPKAHPLQLLPASDKEALDKPASQQPQWLAHTTANPADSAPTSAPILTPALTPHQSANPGAVLDAASLHNKKEADGPKETSSPQPQKSSSQSALSNGSLQSESQSQSQSESKSESDSDSEPHPAPAPKPHNGLPPDPRAPKKSIPSQYQQQPYQQQSYQHPQPYQYQYQTQPDQGFMYQPAHTANIPTMDAAGAGFYFPHGQTPNLPYQLAQTTPREHLLHNPATAPSHIASSSYGYGYNYGIGMGPAQPALSYAPLHADARSLQAAHSAASHFHQANTSRGTDQQSQHASPRPPHQNSTQLQAQMESSFKLSGVTIHNPSYQPNYPPRQNKAGS